MRILFVTPYLPSLIRVRPLNFIKQLSRHHELTLISLAQDGSPDDETLELLRGYCEDIYVLPLPKAGSLLRCCRSLLSGMPLQAAYTDLPAGRELVARIAEKGAFDVLHVEHIRGARLSSGVGGIPRIYDSVDCITRLLKQRLQDGCGAFQRALSIEEILKMRAYEPRVAASFDSIVITSEHDRRALECLIRRFASDTNGPHCPDDRASQRRLIRLMAENSQDARLDTLEAAEASRIAVIRNGVDSEYFHPMGDTSVSPVIAFSGKMGYFPNSTAVLRFYDEVFPVIRKKRPDARFRIIGSDPPDSVRKLVGDPAVEVTGYVPDIRPYLASSWVVVCPLTVGVGVQNKVLEAMAMGKPVVATSVAVNGIPGVVDGRHIMRADSSEEMADAVIRLMAYPEAGRTMGDCARRFVVEGYSWETAARKLEDTYGAASEACRNRIPAAA